MGAARLSTAKANASTFASAGISVRAGGLWLAAAGLAAYYGSFHGAYFLDDYGCLVGNASLAELWPAASDVPHGLQRRPVGRLSFWLNYQLGGLDPWGYHLVNLWIHLAAGLTLFGLIRRTLELPGVSSRLKERSVAIGFFAALLWLVHPLNTESVTYVVQRLESLMGLLFLACWYSLLRGATSAAASRPWYCAAVACFWLGVGTKEVMIAALPVLLLFDRIFLSHSWRAVLVRRWTVYAGMAPVALWLAHVLTAPPADGQVSAGFQLPGVTSWHYLLTQSEVILYYLHLAAWPVDLCFDYGWPVVRSPREVFWPLVIVGSLFVGCLMWLPRRPRILFPVAAFFLVLAPTSSIMPIADVAVEHRMYLPLAGLIVLTVVAVQWAGDALFVNPVRRRYATVLFSCAALLLATHTFARNRLYADPIAMWADAAGDAPHNARAVSNLGSALCRAHRFAEGEWHLRQAVQMAPSDPSHRLKWRKAIQLRALADRD